MAQGSPRSVSPGKRELDISVAEFGPPLKKQRRPYHHHHEVHHKFSGISTSSEAAFLEDSHVDLLLKRAIATQCQAYGFEEIEGTALESFRDAVDEFVYNFTSFVRQSMVACRRAKPLFVDFEWAFDRTKVPHQWREGELPFEELEHDVLLPPNDNSAITLLPTPPPEDQEPPSLDELSISRTGAANREKKFLPTSFPTLPAPHAYKQTEVYSKREADPRKIRELATEEGRMGEDALRKLAGATRIETKLNIQDGPKEKARKLDWSGKEPVSADNMFERTMESIMMKEMLESSDLGEGGAEVKFELGPIVNWERAYYMQPTATGRIKSNSGTANVKGNNARPGAMDLS